MTQEVSLKFHGRQVPEPMTFSLSAFQDWQACQMKYNFRHRRRLRPKVSAPALEIGIVLHEYLESYYESLQRNMNPQDAHAMGLSKIATHTRRLEIAAAAAMYAGDEELAEEVAKAPGMVLDIASRYFKVRGATDGLRHQILIVEKKIDVLLVAGVRSISRIDMVSRDRENGRVFLWEHKSTQNMPNTSFRLRDLQTTLYAEILLNRHQVKVDEILWNYLRTKPPSVPHQNKPKRVGEIGALSKDKSIDTTWDLYAAKIAELGLDFEDYQDVFERLKDAETTKFFPRYSNQIVVDRGEILLDYALGAAAARRARLEWDAGTSRPTRTLGRNCDFCPFLKICEAELMGGDGEEVVRLRFTEGGKPIELEEEPQVV